MEICETSIAGAPGCCGLACIQLPTELIADMGSLPEYVGLIRPLVCRVDWSTGKFGSLPARRDADRCLACGNDGAVGRFDLHHIPLAPARHGAIRAGNR